MGGNTGIVAPTPRYAMLLLNQQKHLLALRMLTHGFMSKL